MTNPADLIYTNPLSGRDCESYDDETNEQVTVIRIKTFEGVTPAYLAWRVAQACAGSALREGESVSADGLEFTVGPLEPFEWPGRTLT